MNHGHINCKETEEYSEMWRSIVWSLILVLTIPAPSLGILSKCLELKQAKMDKTFRQKFLSGMVYFPIGQNLDIIYGHKEQPHVFPRLKDGLLPKCFSITIVQDIKGHQQQAVSTVPFVCVRDPQDTMFCHMNTKFTEAEAHPVPLNLWGSATVAKTDNRNYMLVVSCNKNKIPSWILLHRNHPSDLPKEQEQEILEYVTQLGFNPSDTFSFSRSQNTSFLWMDYVSNCPKNSWPPQIN